MLVKQFIKHVIDKNGIQLQLIVAMEEMAELTKELSKFIRNKNNRDCIAEEVADVQLMLYELYEIFDIDDLEIQQRIHEKVERNIKTP